MDLFNNNKNITVLEDIGADTEIKISFTTRSPLLQTDSLGGKKAGTSLFTKRMYKLFDGIDYPVAIPVYSANAVRGMLRREAFDFILKIGKKVNPKLSLGLDTFAVNFHTSGGSNAITSFNKIKMKQKEALKAALPNISIFGAGLSEIEGKLAVSELSPRQEQCIKIDSDGKTHVVDLVKTIAGVRKNDGANSERFAYLISEEDAKKFEEAMNENSKLNKEFKELKAKKAKKGGPKLTKQEEERLKELDETKNLTQQIPFDNEYVPAGVEFSASIAPKRGIPLTNVEKGILFASLFGIANSQLGSLKNKGYGVGDWIISSSEGDMSSIADPAFYLSKKTQSIEKSIEELIAEAEEYIIENKIWENLNIDNLMQRL